MNIGQDRERRPYSSPLREAQAAATRRRILDAAIAETRAGRADPTVPSLAKAAGCSVATVYRHFPTRQDLLAAAHEHLHTLVPLPPFEPDPERMPEQVRAFFEHQERVHAFLGVDVETPDLRELRRHVTVPRRRPYLDQVVAHWAPGLAEPQRTWFVDLLVVLISSNGARAFREYLELDGGAAADRMTWLLDALRAHAVREQARNSNPHAQEPTR